MSHRRDDRMSEGSVDSIENPPFDPPHSPGSSVSTLLQEEYDELLKYAVVVPDYNSKDSRSRLADTRGAFDKQEIITTLRASPPQAGLLRDLDRLAQKEEGEETGEEGETSSPRRKDQYSGSVKQLPDFGGESPINGHGPASFTRHLRVDASEEEQRPPHTEPLFPNTAQSGNGRVGSSHMRNTSAFMADPDPMMEESGPGDVVYTATIDQDVSKMETMMDQWCLDLKRNVLAEFSQAKVVIKQKCRQELLRETKRHCKEKAELVKELDSLKEYLHTYEQTLDRKDAVIANLTKAMYRHRDKYQLMKNFCQWRTLHNDVKREAFTLQMARLHHEKTLKRRVMLGWFSHIHCRWRHRVEKACQTKSQEICIQVTNDYESKIFSMNEVLELQRQEIRQLHLQRESYEDAMKKAFMRGVCALNMEAMTIFHAEDGAENQAAPPQFSGREEREREEEVYSDNLGAHFPDKGPPSVKTIPQDRNQNNFVVRSSIAPADNPPPRVMTSQGSRSIPAGAAPSHQMSAKASSSAAHKGRVVVAKLTGKGGDSGRPGGRSLSPSVHAPMASVVVERHQPVTKQTIGHATATKLTRATEADKFRKLAGQQGGTVGKPPPIHTVRVVD